MTRASTQQGTARLKGRLRVRSEATDAPKRVEEPALQLALGRGGVALELSAPVSIGASTPTGDAPLTILEARARVVGATFPLDVSGGVDRFRHRRTVIDRTVFRLDATAIERWLGGLASDLVGKGSCDARVVARVEEGRVIGATVTLSARRTAVGSPAHRPPPVLAFDVVIGAPARGGGQDATAAIVAIVEQTRAVGVESAPSVIAGRILARIANAIGGRAEGLRLELDDPARPIALASLVARGARLPATTGLVLAAIETVAAGDGARLGAIEITLSRGDAAAPPTALARCLETDRLVGAADVEWLGGREDAARALYLRAIERAPKHPTILERLAELDAFFLPPGARAGGDAAATRNEPALGWLRDAYRAQRDGDAPDNEGARATGRLLLAAMLHARSGADGQARRLFVQAADAATAMGETALAARALATAATIGDAPAHETLSLVDRALSSDPSLVEARWLRVRLDIASADVARVAADLQHLEAQARGREARRRMLLTAASLWSESGRAGDAIDTYARALRYTPDDRETVAGLAMALGKNGDAARSVSLLAHALTLVGDVPGHDALCIELARTLDGALGDLPAAIARLRDVADDAPHGTLARALEGALCARIGDVAGASTASSRAADLAAQRIVADSDTHEVAALLMRATEEAAALGDTLHALRLVRGAVAVAPTDPAARTLAASLGRAARASLATTALVRAGAKLSETPQESPVPAKSLAASSDVSFGESVSRSPRKRVRRPFLRSFSETPQEPPVRAPSPTVPSDISFGESVSRSLRKRVVRPSLRSFSELPADEAPIERVVAKAAVVEPKVADPIDEESEAETLLSRFKGGGADDALVDRLVELLAKFGRDFELFALLSARFDDATPSERARLLPSQRAVLAKLAMAADASGRAMEASLYRDAASALDR